MNGYENIDEYYEDLGWDEIYDDPTTEMEAELYEYYAWLAEQDENEPPF